MSELGALVAAQTDLPLTRVSQLLGAGRTTLYRLRRAQPVREAEMELRDRIQRIALGDARLRLPPHHGHAAAGGATDQP